MTTQISNFQVKSDWLDGVENVRRYDFMAIAVRLQTMRILLPGYGCQMWYLGERVYHQHLGPSRRCIPFPIPSLMLQRCSLTGSELRVALEGYDALTLLERSRHYQQYIQENILEQVPTGAAEVYTPTSCSLFSLSLASYTDYYLQFEEVGSPVADEAMEEQADTETTETARANHTQHVETVRGEPLAGTTLGDISLLDRSMYYWAPAVQTPIEQHIDFDAMQPHVFSPPNASHVSII